MNANLELPKKKVKALRKSPKNMVLYGPPKIGKTTALSSLDKYFLGYALPLQDVDSSGEALNG